MNTQSTRAGQYIQQANGYKAFIPTRLPPADPQIRIDRELQKLLSQADRFLGRLDGSIQTLPDPDLFVLMYVRKEAVLSSQIEGTQSSLSDVLEAEAQITDPGRPQDVAEVINYINATSYGLERLKEIPISVRLLKELHKILLKDVRGNEKSLGEIRSSQNWIGPPGSSPSSAVFIPPPPHEMKVALSDLEKYLHSHNTGLPLLLDIGLTHAQFETIHPFLDGNGRIGRLLITLSLCEKEVLISPVLYLSNYLKQFRQEYYNCLQRIRMYGEWEAWLKFFLIGVAEVSREATETARKIVALRESDRKSITTKFGRTAANGLTVLEYLYSNPVINVRTIKRLIDVSYPAANQLMERFVESGILREVTGRSRNRRYRYAGYIELFS